VRNPWKLGAGLLLLVAASALGLKMHGVRSSKAVTGIDSGSFTAEAASPAGMQWSGESVSLAELDSRAAANASQGVTAQVLFAKQYSALSAQASATAALQYTFPVRYPIDHYAGAVAIGDLDGDGQNEVVVAYSLVNEDGRLDVYRRVPTGLALSQTYNLGAKYSSFFGGIAIGDLNEDGKADVAVAMQTGIGLLVSRGASHVATLVPDNWSVTQLGMMDVNRDGHLDIVSLHWGDIMGGVMPNATRLYFGDGAGGFTGIQDMATSQRGRNDLKIGDVTSDGIPDLVITSAQAFDFWVIAHDGVSGFKPGVAYPRPSTWGVQSAAIADVDHDGNNEVIIATGGNVPNTAIWIYPQQNGVLGAPARVYTSDLPATMLGQDLDGDGRDDVAVMHEGELGIYLQNGRGTLQPETYARAVGYGAFGADDYNRQGVAAADITGDGCPDVAIGDYNWGLVIIEGMNCAPSKSPVTGGNLSADPMN